MKKLTLLIIIIFISSCDDYKDVESEIKQEKGFVVAMQFRGEINESAPTIGITTNGDLSLGSTSIHVSEQFDVVFKCEHGTIFTINDKNIYAKFREKDSVIIDYVEIHTYDGKFKDFKFLDANKIKK